MRMATPVFFRQSCSDPEPVAPQPAPTPTTKRSHKKRARTFEEPAACFDCNVKDKELVRLKAEAAQVQKDALKQIEANRTQARQRIDIAEREKRRAMQHCNAESSRRCRQEEQVVQAVAVAVEMKQAAKTALVQLVEMQSI